MIIMSLFEPKNVFGTNTEMLRYETKVGIGKHIIKVFDIMGYTDCISLSTINVTYPLYLCVKFLTQFFWLKKICRYALNCLLLNCIVNKSSLIVYFEDQTLTENGIILFQL